MKRFYLLALGFMVVLAMAAVGCGDDSSGGGASAAERIDKAWTKMNETKAVHADFDVQMDVDGDLSSLGSEFSDLLPASMGVTGSADVDQTDEENIKADISLELDIGDLLDKAIQASGGGSLSSEDAAGVQMLSGMLKDISIRIVDQTMYIEIMGSWYEADMSDVSDVSGSSGLDLGTSTDVDTQCLENGVTPSRVLKDISEEGSEKVGDADTTHFKASLDSGAAVDLMADLSKECGDEEMTDSDITEAKDVLGNMLTTADIELWIDGDDNIRKMTIVLELDMSSIADTAGSAIDPSSADVLNGLTVKANMTVEMSRFDEEVTVEVPSDAMPLEDLLGSFGGLGGGSTDDFGLGDSGTGTTDDFDFGGDSTTGTDSGM